jgi:hypothetical protein
MIQMKNVLFLLVFAISFFSLEAQVTNQNQNRNQMQNNQLFQNDSTTFKDEIQIMLDGTTSYTDYKKFTIHNDSSFVDTTLTINKDYKFNYIRKDDFELLPFSNQGQTYNKLTYDFGNSMFPDMGASAKQYNYYQLEDIPFYHVPTPTSELMYRTGFEQGQVLDAFLTANTSPQFNLSIAYKGLRSLGKYRHTLASHGNFRTNFNYHNKKKTYYLKGQFYSYDFLNNENGGLTDESITNFENNDPNYTDRARLDVHYTNAENMYEGKRYYVEQKLSLFTKKNATLREEKKQLELKKIQDSIVKSIQIKERDSINKRDSITLLDPNFKIDSLAVTQIDTVLRTPSIVNQVTVREQQTGNSVVAATAEQVNDSLPQITVDPSYFDFFIEHSFTYETKHYRFKQESPNEIFGSSFSEVINDHSAYKYSRNEVRVGLNSNTIGMLRIKGSAFDYNYHYSSILFYNDQTIPDKLEGNTISVGADWKKQIGKLSLSVDVNSMLSGDLEGESIQASVGYKKDSIFSIKAFGKIISRTPSFNKLLFQSDYVDYNWKNNFDNEEITTFGGELIIDKWGSVRASYNTIDNYTYFDENSMPIQAQETLTYLKAKVNLTLSYRKFFLENTVLYQKVTDGDTFFHVPELLTRNSLYFASHLFKGDPLFLQTGVTVKYFLPYNLPAYNPLLSEFIVQNTEEFGGFPILDFFVNAQIQRTRLYLKAENFAGAFTGRNYYAAPRYPYRDFTVRFGLVWNFFI